MSKWQWIVRQLSGRLWVRTSLFCILAIITALAGLFLKDFIPEDVSRKIGSESVDNILQIIASSMLAVTTFSLSIMVAAYGAATTNVTPRATQLLLRDGTTQNALSVFIGAFLYSLVGIIALSMGIYGNSGRLVLFAMTIVVILCIVVVLLQWIHYLSRLGRVSETIDLVEKATEAALAYHRKMPCLGGVPLTNYHPQPSHRPLYSPDIGYLQYIDVATLAKIARAHDVEFYLRMVPGSFNDAVGPLLYSSKTLSEADMKLVRGAFQIGERSFDQDPRFGMIVLGEIASRALSPAINDPGTAIDVVATGIRLLLPWLDDRAGVEEPCHAMIHVPPLRVEEMLDDIFGGIARDGAGSLPAGIRLQKAFRSLAQTERGREACQRLSRYALDYCMASKLLPADKEVVTAIASTVGQTEPKVGILQASLGQA